MKKYHRKAPEDRPIKAWQFSPETDHAPLPKRVFRDEARGETWFRTGNGCAERIKPGDWAVRQHGYWQTYQDEDFREEFGEG